MTRRGLFIDLYSTSAYQDVTSGGLKTGTAFLQNIQLSVNLDTGRAGLWPGGLLHFTLDSRYGASPEQTFTVGSFVPQYYGAIIPGATLSRYCSNIFLFKPSRLSERCPQKNQRS